MHKMPGFSTPRRPNAPKQVLLRLAWSGGGLKAGWKGFGRSIKMKEKFSDLIFQNFWSKTAEIGNILLAFVGLALRRVGTTLAHTTGKSSSRYAFWRVPHTQRPLEACEPAPFTPKTRRLWGKVSIEVRWGTQPDILDHAWVNGLHYRGPYYLVPSPGSPPYRRMCT